MIIYDKICQTEQLILEREITVNEWITMKIQKSHLKINTESYDSSIKLDKLVDKAVYLP